MPQIAIDASHIKWVCTANDVSRIASPILSRLRIFEVPSPTHAQTRKIVSSVFLEAVEGLLKTVKEGDYFTTLSSMRLSKEALDCLSCMPIRIAKRELRTAIAKALTRHSSEVYATDLIDLDIGRFDASNLQPH